MTNKLTFRVPTPYIVEIGYEKEGVFRMLGRVKHNYSREHIELSMLSTRETIENYKELFITKKKGVRLSVVPIVHHFGYIEFETFSLQWKIKSTLFSKSIVLIDNFGNELYDIKKAIPLKHKKKSISYIESHISNRVTVIH